MPRLSLFELQSILSHCLRKHVLKLSLLSHLFKYKECTLLAQIVFDFIAPFVASTQLHELLSYFQTFGVLLLNLLHRSFLHNHIFIHFLDFDFLGLHYFDFLGEFLLLALVLLIFKLTLLDLTLQILDFFLEL